MARKEVVLITGASGEVGHGLITHLAEHSDLRLIALDVQPLEDSLRAMCHEFIQGDILDTMLLGRLVFQYEIRTIYHLASILSTRAEFKPEAAHRVNVDGTLNLLNLAVEQSGWQGRPVKFLFPSSIAVYGIPDLATKVRAGPVKEDDWCFPTTIYGCNKLYCEHLGRYYASHYRQLAVDKGHHTVDFRCVRYPGIISAFTVPTGGTSDYGPEMLHYAARAQPYRCFVRPDTQIPFMTMPDAVTALTQLEAGPGEQLTNHVYNLTSFSLTAAEIYDRAKRYFPKAEVSFEPDPNRQRIIDTWPAELDDSAARADWGWQPRHDEQRAFEEYLIPNIMREA
jgi:threonine 3-dehydrogenase